MAPFSSRPSAESTLSLLSRKDNRGDYKNLEQTSSRLQYGPSARLYPDSRQSSTSTPVSSDSGHAQNGMNVVSKPNDPSAAKPFNPQDLTESDDDDYLHAPDDLYQRKGSGFPHPIFSLRGIANVGCIVLLAAVLLGVFLGYPVATAILNHRSSAQYSSVTYSGVPFLHNGLIDPTTPEHALWKESMETGENWKLVFSDEFNTSGRTFYPGDDPYWEAADLHYHPTNNLEWYDPKMITTRDGKLVITFTDEKTGGMNYTGGMISTWNRFCFTGGYVEASVSLPGRSDVAGLWPAIWSMGNLGRAGYGGTNDGLWPYSYNVCDVGTLRNQTLNGQPKLPEGLGDKYHDDAFSYLPGQRFSACTCPGDPSHPGPILPDGTYVGRSAPEIDMFEAAVDDGKKEGHVSLSAQWAPFNPGYAFLNSTPSESEIMDTAHAEPNSYQGSYMQQAASVLGVTDQDCYTQNTGCSSVYGFEYEPKSYITWRSNNIPSWTIRQAAMAPNAMAQVGQRDVSVEPMYLIVNLGMSEDFGFVDFEALAKMYPVEMHVDYIRVYQHPDRIATNCDPSDYPTAEFIKKYPQAFGNPNITRFEELQLAYPDLAWPKNRLVDQC